MASEIFVERWTPIVLREMCLGPGQPAVQLFRDAQGARFHPLQEGPQKALTARAALGLEM